MKAHQVVEFGARLVSRRLRDPMLDARALVVDVMSCGLGVPRAGKVTGRIVHVHGASSYRE